MLLPFNQISLLTVVAFVSKEQVGKMKLGYDHHLFLKSMASEFKQFLEIVSKMKYEDKPDYKVSPTPFKNLKLASAYENLA